MEGVEIKETKKVKVIKKKLEAVKPEAKNATLVAFMEKRNEMRKLAGLPEAYSSDEIDLYR